MGLHQREEQEVRGNIEKQLQCDDVAQLKKMGNRLIYFCSFVADVRGNQLLGIFLCGWMDGWLDSAQVARLMMSSSSIIIITIQLEIG